MGFLHYLGQDGGRVIGVGVIPLKQLFGGHHDLVRGFAAAASPTHAIGYDGQNAAIDARVFYERDLVLLVLAVALVYSCGSSESVTSGHVDLLMKQYFLQKDSKVVLSSQHDRLFCSLYPYLLALLLVTNLHSPERHLIELRIEHGDLDALIDRAAHDAPVDELMMRRLKKRRLSLRDEIARVERELQPNEPA